MERKLYPGIAFSPQTTLTENIGEADTIIKVSDVSAFPEAPNLATIGIDEDGETILYTAKTEDALSGCQRGVEGTAKAWKAGEIIGRNFTAKDHNDLIAAVGEIGEAATTAQDAAAAAAGAATEATETAEQAAQDAEQAKKDAQTAADAAATAKGAAENANKTADAIAKAAEDIWQRVINPTLLDNAYWALNAAIINQRGEKEYHSQGYTIDRWNIRNNTIMTLDGDGITYTFNGGPSGFSQVIEFPETILNKTITVSVLIDENTVDPESGHPIFGLHYANNSFTHSSSALRFSLNGGTGLLSRTGKITSMKDYSQLNFGMYTATAGRIKIRAMKLELGDTQTLAHQENGEWVLNDPPPNYAQELAKCQRYYQVFSSADLRPQKAVDFRPPMRIDPALSTIEVDGSTYYTADANL